MTNKPIWSIARYCALLVIGNAMFALGFNLFLVPNSLNVGGLSGIAMILQRLLGRGGIGLYTAVESLSESFALRNYGTQHGQLYKPEQMDIADMITGMEKNMFFLFRRIFYYTCRCGYVIIEAKDKVGICKWGGEACWICGTRRKIRGMDCRCKFNPEILKGLRASVYQRLALENGGKLRMSPTTKRSKTTRGIGGK